MPPKPTHPRLDNIDPNELATDVRRAVNDHIEQQRISIVSLRSTVAALANYAQRGLGATDWSSDDRCENAIVEVAAALYSCAGDLGTIGRVAGLPDDLDADDEIGVVLLAASARQSIALGQPVKSKELAALANLNYQRIRELIRAGELRELKAGNVGAFEAKRFLQSRNDVIGFLKGGK